MIRWGLIKLIIIVDTIFLSILSNKIIKNRPKNIVSLKEVGNLRINYFDIGTHQKAEEIHLILKNIFKKHSLNYHIYAFEAHPELCQHAANLFVGNDRVNFYNLALCNRKHDGEYMRLFLKSNNGLGNSIFEDSTPNFINVPCRKISEVIKENKIPLKNSINLIRMNVEGAEWEILKDLTEQKLHTYFNGFYGMWDDVVKKSLNGKDFNRMLKLNGISNLTFNGRDMKHSKRKSIIIKNIESAILMGIRRPLEY